LFAFFFAADVFAKIIVSAGIILAAKERNFALESGRDLLPLRDRSAFGPDFPKLLDGNLLHWIGWMGINRKRVIADDKFFWFFARDAFDFFAFLRLHIARGVADVGAVVLHGRDARAGPAAIGVDKDVR